MYIRFLGFVATKLTKTMDKTNFLLCYTIHHVHNIWIQDASCTITEIEVLGMRKMYGFFGIQIKKTLNLSFLCRIFGKM
jgi:hypothetical protein